MYLKTLSSLLKALSVVAVAAVAAAPSLAQPKKPNILVIWGDDIGQFNISAFNRGMMGYKTPNIDRLAREGVAFTDYYGQQSSTAGRAAFINGSVPVRTGMTKVGDSSAPSANTLRILREMQATRTNLDVVMFPTADHGILEFEEKNGTRVPIRIAEGYLQLVVDWILFKDARVRVAGPIVYPGGAPTTRPVP